MADTQAQKTLDALNAILEEMRELRMQFETFSNGGFPLRQTVPSNELLAATTAAAAVLSRDLPLTHGDVQRRIQMAMVISREVIAHFDTFQQASQPQSLDNLAQR
jgi:hypothetical protein